MLVGEASPAEQPLGKVESKTFITTNWEVLCLFGFLFVYYYYFHGDLFGFLI